MATPTKTVSSRRWPTSREDPWDQWFASCGSWEAPSDYGSISKAVCMDDRTAIKSSSTDLVQTCLDWTQWSETTRLRENWAKPS